MNNRQDRDCMEEKKYESDMTRKEKRQQERAKIAGLKGKKKADYIWGYYKWHIIIAIALLLVICGLIDMYRSAQREEVFCLAIVDEGAVDAETLQSDIKELLGYELEDGHYYVTADIAIPMSDAENEEGNIKIAALRSAEAGDVMICPESTYEYYEEQELFLDLKTFFTEEEYAGYEAYIDGNRIAITNREWLEKYGFRADITPYFAIANYGNHPESARKVLAYVLDGNE